MKPTVFIQSNEEQFLGALVASHALRRNSRRKDEFDVRILHYNDFPWLHAREGQEFWRGGERRVWKRHDLQSFTPLRFAPPKLMNYEGRSVVIDPDCFAVGDVWELISRDMKSAALMCRTRPAFKDLPAYRASSVMLLDNSRLRHWDAEKTFNELFMFKVDYMKWIKLEYEPDESVGPLEDVWNDFDHLTPQTKILHTTYRRTQPWKTGLPIDFTVRTKSKPVSLAKSAIRAMKRMVKPAKPGFYEKHPDPSQERLFFSLLAECLAEGSVTEETIKREMAANHVRHDALDLCAKVAA
jgi:hypothetical protein